MSTHFLWCHKKFHIKLLNVESHRQHRLYLYFSCRSYDLQPHSTFTRLSDWSISSTLCMASLTPPFLKCLSSFFSDYHLIFADGGEYIYPVVPADQIIYIYFSLEINSKTLTCLLSRCLNAGRHYAASMRCFTEQVQHLNFSLSQTCMLLFLFAHFLFLSLPLQYPLF